MGEIRVHKITKPGYGSNSGQIPPDLKVPLLLFDYLNEKDAAAKRKTKYLTQQLNAIKEKKTNKTFRCPRKGFTPFDVVGKLTRWARNDGIPPMGPKVIVDKEGGLLKSPLYLVLDMRDGFIAALAVLFEQADNSLKLEYLCAAPKFKGAGSALLAMMKKGTIFKPVFKGVKRLYLNNNSQIPNYYTKKGFEKVGKTKYLMKGSAGQDVDKILNVYKASMMPSKSISKLSKKPVSKKLITKKPKPVPTSVVRTRRKPLPPPKNPLYVLRKRIIYQS